MNRNLWQVSLAQALMMSASMLMARIGRKAGFLSASAIGLCGAGFAGAGVRHRSFALFCPGSIGTGVQTAFGNYFRFAHRSGNARAQERRARLGARRRRAGGGALLHWPGWRLVNYPVASSLLLATLSLPWPRSAGHREAPAA